MDRITWALTRDLTAPPRLLLVALVHLAPADDDRLAVGQRDLSSLLHMSERQVREHLATLTRADVIEREPQHGPNGARHADLIVLKVPEAA